KSGWRMSSCSSSPGPCTGPCWRSYATWVSLVSARCRGRSASVSFLRRSLSSAMPPPPGNLVHRAGLREREGGDLRVELAPVLRHHAVSAVHRAVGRLQHGAARVLELLPGPEHRLVAHHPFAA